LSTQAPSSREKGLCNGISPWLAPLAMVASQDIGLRLAALFRRQNQPEVAVPLLVEVVKVMTPTSPEGRKAFQSLVEIGFAATPYTAGAAATPGS